MTAWLGHQSPDTPQRAARAGSRAPDCARSPHHRSSGSAAARAGQRGRGRAGIKPERLSVIKIMRSERKGYIYLLGGTRQPRPARDKGKYKCKYKYTEVSCTTQTLTLCTRAHTFNPTSGSRLAHLGFAARARVRASARVGDNLERHGEAHLLVQLQLGGGRADTLDRRHGDLLAVHDHAWMARWSGSGPASGLDEIRTSRIRDRVRGGHWGRLLSP